MNYKRQLKTLVKQTYPSSQYPWKERNMYRKMLYREMITYWNTHPGCSIEDVTHTYCECDDSLPNTPQGKNPQKLLRLVLLSLCIILLLAIGIYFICQSWEAPTIQL